MNKKQIALGVVLLDFVAFTAYVVVKFGYVGLFQAAMANAATLQVLIDLTIVCSMFLFWMWQDARQHGISPLPYALLVCTLGSIGALLYLIRRAGLETSAAPQSVLAGRAQPARAGA
jgi:uncharacterized protein DUF2834